MFSGIEAAHGVLAREGTPDMSLRNELQRIAPKQGYVLAAILFIGAALRIYGLDSGLWYDEIVTLIESVRPPLREIVTHFPSQNDHLLYSVLGHISIGIFGENAWSLRLPAFLFGLLSLPIVYVLGVSVTSRFEATAAAALLAISYHHIWFSQNARGYTILLFCALLATHLLLRGLRTNQRSDFVAFGVVTALAAYAHLTMIIVAVAQALVVAAYLLASRNGRPQANAWTNAVSGFAFAGLLTVLFYLPLILDIRSFFAYPSETKKVATASWAILETLKGLQLAYMGAGVFVGALVFVVGCWSYLRQSPTVLALFFVPPLAVFATAVVLQHPIRPRFFFFAAGFALLVIMRGAVVVAKWIARPISRQCLRDDLEHVLPVLAFAGMAVVSVLALPAGYRHPKQDYEGALNYVVAKSLPGELIASVGSGTSYVFQKYYRRPWRRLRTATELEAAQKQFGTVWLLYTFEPYIEALEPEMMKAIRTNCMEVKIFQGTIADGNIVLGKCGHPSL
jgi:4-amino-4-deoxy-L-arabinose transferase-like glycosyltransferase